MKYTNRKNLPAALVAACTNDPYSAGDADISITRLIAPPRQVELIRRHFDAIEVDVADRIWALRSQGIHAILERAAGENEVAEERWTRDCLGWTVSGKTDLVSVKDHVLTDWKDTSVWSIKDALDPTSRGKREWTEQVNLLALFGEQYAIEKVQVVAFGRDWRKNEARNYPESYPDAEVSVVPLKLWPREQTQAFLEERVRLHQRARRVQFKPLVEGGPLVPDDTLDCTPEERWEKPTMYAVAKKGNKNATRVYDDRALAEKHLESQPGLELRVRPGASARCRAYCDAYAFCTQGQAIVAAEDQAAQALRG
jgi:hypothetical protein